MTETRTNIPENNLLLTMVCVLSVLVLSCTGCSDIAHEDVPRTTVDMNTMQMALELYKREFGEFPMGSNSEIVAALTGDNGREIVFIYLELSPNGEYLDPWGSPFFG